MYSKYFWLIPFSFLAQPINRKPSVGDIFGIWSSIDGSFNRGSVKEILNENEYRVVLFDLGTTDIVSTNNFREIPKELKQVIFLFINFFY